MLLLRLLVLGSVFGDDTALGTICCTNQYRDQRGPAYDDKNMRVFLNVCLAMSIKFISG